MKALEDAKKIGSKFLVMDEFAPWEAFARKHDMIGAIFKSTRGITGNEYNATCLAEMINGNRDGGFFPDEWLSIAPEGANFVHQNLFFAEFATKEQATAAILKTTPQIIIKRKEKMEGKMMSDTIYYLSECGNIWAVDNREETVCCNGRLITNEVKIDDFPTCELDETLLIIKNDGTNAYTESANIVAINKNITEDKIQRLCDELRVIKNLYGPIELCQRDGEVFVYAKSGFVVFSTDRFVTDTIMVATIDFRDATIKRIDTPLKDPYNIAIAIWSQYKNMIEESRTIDCDPDESLDWDNDDIMDLQMDDNYTSILENEIASLDTGDNDIGDEE